jgi:methyl-accepting chemotaxis protein
MIEGFQKSTKSAVTSMADARDRVRVSVDEIGKIAETLESINASVASISEMNTVIAQSTRDQTSRSETVNEALHAIRDVAQKTLDDTSKMLEDSDNLTEMTGELQLILSEFKFQ